MHTTHYKFCLPGLTLTLLLAACGGSGSDSTTTPGTGDTTTASACALVPTQTGTASSTAAIDCSCDGTRSSPSLSFSSEVKMSCTSTQRTIASNGIPDHAVGTFPNAGNPNTISEQVVSFVMSLVPIKNSTSAWIQAPGYTRNGVKMEPETAESYGNAGVWRYEAIQDVYNLGLDMNKAHVQPTGAYHYHGMPEEYLTLLNKGSAMTLVGWAADGFPIYARYGYNDPNNAASGVKVVKPNYRLKAGAEISSTRPSISATEQRGNTTVGSLPLGVFVADWTYDTAVGGDLDECNGRYGVTPEFPNGIYHYYVTDAYPYIQRCVFGTTVGGGTTPPGPPPQ